MLQLKRYQEKSLEVLKKYLELARYKGAKQAYDEVQLERYGSSQFKNFQPIDGLADTPYVCLRLPTGGGKTLLASHSVKLAGEAYVENEYPLTLWLVPTNIIKEQTLEALKNSNNANRQVLENAFNGRFRIFDIADFRQVRPQDITDAACIVVSTFASLRVDKPDGRKVYDHDENLEPHFSKITNASGTMLTNDAGKINFSFANLLNWHRPLVIVDEAHNAKSDLSIEVLNRINASCVIEYTATPATNSNVIHSVSAAELKAEQMIKLPVILTPNISWEEAITASVQTRQKLEEIAVKDKDYIRPIILFQAENKDKSTTVEVIEKFLVENEGIDRKQIAIATGEQKELDSIDLFKTDCPIRYIITVQALKEGWDCSFAYVLCSVANISSSTAIEQLLGRVLRMPYAQSRSLTELNQAYAHVSAPNWVHAAEQLRDKLVSMGFEKQEALESIYEQPPSDLFAERGVPELEVTLTTAPDLSNFTSEEKRAVTVEQSNTGTYTLKVSGEITPAIVEKLSKSVSNKEDKKEITFKGELHIKRQEISKSPCEKGEVFEIPQLCLNFEDGPELAEQELFLDESGWNPLDYPTVLDKDTFSVDDETQNYKIDISGQKIQIDPLGKDKQLDLEGIHTDMSDIDLCRWLDRRLKDINSKQEFKLEFLRRVIKNLLARGDLDLAKIVRGKFILEKVLREKLALYKKDAYKKGYQKLLFGPDSIACVSPANHNFKFSKEYPTNRVYDGRYKYDNHYYARIGEMNNEEDECALALDRNPLIEFWVRNIEKQPRFSFFLPTSTDNFYPDFIAKLKDGRILVVEYKGAHLDNDDTKEKELIGKVWAEKSGNLFLVAWKKDDKGRDVYKQINGIIG